MLKVRSSTEAMLSQQIRKAILQNINKDNITWDIQIKKTKERLKVLRNPSGNRYKH